MQKFTDTLGNGVAVELVSANAYAKLLEAIPKEGMSVHLKKDLIKKQKQ